MKTKILFSAFLIISIVPVKSQIYSIDLLPQAGESFTYANFSIYIPEDCDTIKGIIHMVYWYEADSRNVINDSGYRNLGDQLGFAVLGSLLQSRNMPRGIGRAVLASLDSFSVASNHPELKNAPLFFNGISWGGQWAYDFALWCPERVIGLITQKGGNHTTGFAGDAIHVPFLLFAGGDDSDYRIANLTDIFEENRPYGAPWTLTIEPGAGHDEVTDTALMFSYIRKISELRIPDHTDFDSAVVLKDIALEDGYFGNRTSMITGSMSCYTGNTDLDAWLPDYNLAKKWQQFVSDGRVINNVANIDICEGDSLVIGDAVFKTAGTYYDTIDGCDSIVTLHLNTVSVNTNLLCSDDSIYSLHSSGSYSWLNCGNNYSRVSGAFDRTFIPASTGNYAVRIYDRGCADTSVCCYFQSANSIISHETDEIKIFPNPANNIIQVEYPGLQQKEIFYRIIDLSGKTVKNGFLTGTNIDISRLGKGIYFLNLTIEGQEYYKKIILR